MKRTLLKGLLEPFTAFSFDFSPACFADSIDITDVILNIRLWHGNSLILKYKLFNVENRHEKTVQ